MLQREGPVFVTDAISTSPAYHPKLFSSFIDGKVKPVNGIKVCSVERFPVRGWLTCLTALQHPDLKLTIIIVWR